MTLWFRRTLTSGAFTLLGLLPIRAQTAAPQKPLMAEDVFKNIQVLKGIPVNQFMDTMGFFASALGYNCTNCHGEEVVGSWEKYAVDTPAKRTARRMIEIVAAINKNLFGGRQAVSCFTCHRGSPTPRLAPSLICLLYTSPSPRDRTRSRMPSSA